MDMSWMASWPMVGSWHGGDLKAVDHRRNLEAAIEHGRCA